MDEDHEVDLPFDLSEWTVVDEDEDDAGSSVIKITACSSPTTGTDKNTTSEELVESQLNSSTTNTNNQAASNNTDLASSNPAKSTLPSSSCVAVKNVENSTGSISTSDPANNVATSNAPSSTNDPTKNVAKSNAPSSTNDPTKNVAKSNAPISTNTSAKIVAKSNAPSSANTPAKIVATSNAPSSANIPAKIVATSNAPSSANIPAKIVAKSNVPSSTNTPAKIVVKSNAPSSANIPAKIVATSNAPSSANIPAKIVAKSNVPSSTNTPAKIVAKSNAPSSASNPAKIVAKSNAPSSANTPAKVVAKSNAPSSTNTPAKVVAKSNAPSSANTPTNNVAKSNAPSSTNTPAKIVEKSNAPSSASNTASNVAKSNAPSSANTPVNNVAKSNAPSSASNTANNVAKSNAPSSANTPTNNVAKSNAPSSANTPTNNVAKSNAPSSASNTANNVAKSTSADTVAVKNIAKSVAPPSTDPSNKSSNENKMVLTKNSAPNECLSAGTPPAKPPAKTVASTPQTNKPGEAASVSKISSSFNLSSNTSQIKTPAVAEKIKTPSISSNEQKSQLNSASVVKTTSTNTSSKEATSNVISLPPSSGSSKLGDIKKVNTGVKPTPPSAASTISACNAPKDVVGPVVTSASKPGNAPSSAPAVAKPLASTIKNAGQSPSLQTSTSQQLTQSKTQIINKTNQAGNIAEIMESVSKKTDNESVYQCDMEDISDTELTETLDIANCLVSNLGAAKVAGVKRQASPNNNGPSVKKAKIQSSATSDSVGKQSLTGITTSTNAQKIGPKKPLQSGKVDESTLNKGAKKGSFGAVKIKNQSTTTQSPIKTNSAVAAKKTNEAESKSGVSTVPTTSNMPVKRIVHRFHRMTQTAPKECSNKLLQCLIRIPSIDAAPKNKSNFAIQTVSEKIRDEVFYQKALPDTVRPEVFKVVSTFDLNHPGNRSIITGSFDYGISLGHVTAADMAKSLFRENLVTKSAHYSFHFDREDFGVLDLLFAEEEHFLAAVTQIRKIKIGPRDLVVTYCKNVKETDCTPGIVPSCVKATIIYNQNFLSTGYLTHVKAPVWNKPKVEDTITIHNLPGGIPLDFLKIIIPDAITIYMDDKKQTFTQEGSRVALGMNRKHGGDRFLKLFTQVYVNNECLALAEAGTEVTDVPELPDILKEKEKRQKEKKLPVREIKAVPRDISANAITTVKDEVDVVMHIETVDNVEKVLTGQVSAAWKGPSTVEKLKKVLTLKGQPKTITIQSTHKYSKDSVLSDVSDFSDISDTSNMDEESSIQKKSQKKKSLPAKQIKSTGPATQIKSTGPATQIKSTGPGTQIKSTGPGTQIKSTGPATQRMSIGTATQLKSAGTASKMSKPSSKSTNMRLPQRQGRISKPLAIPPRSSRREPLSVMLRNSRQRTEKTDRFKSERDYRSPSKQSFGKVSPGNRDAKQWKVEGATRDRYDRARSIAGTRRENDSYRKNVVVDKDDLEIAAIREKLRIERLKAQRSKRDITERFDRDDADSSRLEILNSRSERERHRSEGRDDRKAQLNLEVDRWGNRIVSVWKKEEPEIKIKDSYVQDRPIDKPMGVRDNIYNERGRRGKRLDRLVQKRLSSLERQEQHSPDGEDNRVVISRSPNTRRLQRGRSASPRRGKSVSHTSARAKRPSPTPTFGNQNRFARMRRSRSPIQRARPSAMSSNSMGDDEGRNDPEGLWLSQPPAGHHTFQQNVRKTSSRPTNNLAAVQNDWKSSRASQDPEQLDTNKSRKLLEHLVERMIGTKKAPASVSKASSEKHLPSEFVPSVRDHGKLFEKMQEMYSSALSYTEAEPNEASNAAEADSSRAQGRARSGVDYDGKSGSASRPLHRMSLSPAHSKGPGEPVHHFESRFNYEEEIDEEDRQEFDDSAGKKSKMYSRESEMMQSKPGPGGYRESEMMQSKPGPGGYRESEMMQSKPGPGGYRESEMMQSKPGPGGYRESEMMQSKPGPGGYRESEMMQSKPGRGGYRESEMMQSKPGRGGYRESEMMQSKPGRGGYRESEMMQSKPGPGGYRESEMMQSKPGRGGYRESGMMESQLGSEGYRESGMMESQSGPGGYRESGMMESQLGPGGYRESGMMESQSGPGGYRESGMMESKSGPGGYRESGMMESQSGPGGYRESGMMQGPGGYRESGMMESQLEPGGYRESGMMQGPGGYRESGMMESQLEPGGYRESGMMQGPGGYRESGMMANQPNYHQNQNVSLPTPIPPPVTPPVYDSAPISSEDRISQLHSMAKMLAADIENGQNQPQQNVAQEMWNSSSQGFQISGPPPPPPPPPPMSFSGPNSFQGQNMHFSGPPLPFMHPNFQQQHDMYPQPPPWSHGNFF